MRALVVGVRGAVMVDVHGEVRSLSSAQARRTLSSGIGGKRPHGPVLVCHGRATAKRLDLETIHVLDVLELFAFVRPARFCLPTARGVAQELDLPIPATMAREAESLLGSAAALLGQLAEDAPLLGRDLAPTAWAMKQGGWPWADYVLAALGVDPGRDTPHTRNLLEGFRVWNKLKEWEERPPEGPPGHDGVAPDEARARLDFLLGAGGKAERRRQQSDYSAGAAEAFTPMAAEGRPHFILAEAGTGIGKTLGYIAPASVWAEKNAAPVWISTFTRNLQRQLDGELDRLYPDPDEKNRHVVVRKGRENYFCLLNFEEALARLPARPQDAVALGLMARWAQFTRDGDMIGGDFPAWLGDLLGRAMTWDMTDTRGECVYSACAHYKRCFIEHSQRRARQARLVIANHALVLAHAAMMEATGGAQRDPSAPTRYVFDEGHHLFSAADSAFSAQLSGREGGDLRRWILGAEEGARSRSRGLKARLEDLIGDDGKVQDLIVDIRKAAHALPGVGWLQRLSGGQPYGPAETFLLCVRDQVYARCAHKRAGGYSLETPTRPPVDGLFEAARDLDDALRALAQPLGALAACLADKLDDEADELDSAQRARIEGVILSLQRRALIPVKAWRAMLDSLRQGETPAEFVDWLSAERLGGRDVDFSLHRHWVDPMAPFAEVMEASAHGVLVTSATLRDAPDSENAGWLAADRRTGARHIPGDVVRFAHASPFDYAQASRVVVVTDVNKNSADQVAAAYRELLLAAGGGALGLFTAINRLRTVYARIAPALDDAGLALYAQHIDPLDTGTLIDIFRAEPNSCLFGTDAVRDGIDVPGSSLRLIVFDRVPWPRPDILHKARRQAFGMGAYDDMLTRLKLKQAFGRLVRQQGDRGVFIMLDGALPTRLTTAFPEGVEVLRCGLKDAIAEVRGFLSAP
ncbi:ATP-dependent DNA helicase [Varunaivibrio sulfuroxidans]|uniref:ATP-dependent DNA helicase DinG n=1 Tax=Varunaivibrio sulfuroxidans TaxID=1773489 RepID=A0A4R3JD23_9PROT|nr:ATP-dependent DNA helicase [Varunaivibrio sulfuroxidans]TCS63574.1 ATP-dependent DNA helicase DinG [Varunaivibrio sulfuroxidans]WES30283.1 ATP-dependent DNA helicase [Varunaivibrio sulfuroxidans]